MIGIAIKVIAAEAQHCDAYERHQRKHRHAYRVEIEADAAPGKSKGRRGQMTADYDSGRDDKCNGEREQPCPKCQACDAARSRVCAGYQPHQQETRGRKRS